MQLRKKRPTSYLATSAAYTQFQTLKWVGIGAAIVFVLSTLFTVFFLYRNVYVPIGTTEDLDVTEPLQVQVIDFRGLDNAEKAWLSKAASAIPTPKQDPFYNSGSSTVPVSPVTPGTVSTSPTPLPQPTPGTPVKPEI